MKMMRSFDHDIYNVNVTNWSLSGYGDKQYIHDEVNHYAHGHFKICEHRKQTCRNLISFEKWKYSRTWKIQIIAEN